MVFDVKKWMVVLGVIVGGLVVLVCCVFLFVLLWVGILGVWIVNFIVLVEYYLWILSGVLLMLGLSYCLIFSNLKNKCDDGKICIKLLL